MKKALLSAGLACALGLASPAWGQTVIAVDITKAKLRWTHGGATTDAPLDGFRMYCGKTSGGSDKVTDLPPTVREFAIRDAITGSGAWFCRVTAFNQYGESGASNEVPFSAGAVPSTPLTLEVVAQ